mmetsp:Transcript_8371/g.13560  ORF Transcript_8371/g.13560 Transcript_8371/m.13560 type:complete len:476 (+) Transcript_8371:321-1748(+)
MVKLFGACALGDADLKRVIDLESKSYPEDEAASKESVVERWKNASEYFMVAKDEEEIIGFVNGTCSDGIELEEENMSKHVAGGRTLCVHSVVVDERFQRQGAAFGMLSEYVERIRAEQVQVERIVLISKEHLVPFYESVGFINGGLSHIVHGKDPWYELYLSTKMTPVVCVNAFAVPGKRYSGNPAAVCVLPFRSRSLGSAKDRKYTFAKTHSVENDFMYPVAAQMNLSETAFVRSLGAEGENAWRFELRWLTPTSEVDLCGHATQATAFALWLPVSVSQFELPQGVCKTDKFIFETKSGELVASRDTEGRIELNFPAEGLQTTHDTANDLSKRLSASLKIPHSKISFVGENRMDILVEVDSRSTVESLSPDMNKLKEIETRCVIVTAKTTQGPTDFVSRIFGPRFGVPEDPFTGSSHCFLAPYWAEKLNKTVLTAEQLSKRRGKATVEVCSDGRVRLFGIAELSWKGNLMDVPF